MVKNEEVMIQGDYTENTEVKATSKLIVRRWMRTGERGSCGGPRPGSGHSTAHDEGRYSSKSINWRLALGGRRKKPDKSI